MKREDGPVRSIGEVAYDDHNPVMARFSVEGFGNHGAELASVCGWQEATTEE
jgi:hypothetical protein